MNNIGANNKSDLIVTELVNITPEDENINNVGANNKSD